MDSSKLKKMGKRRFMETLSSIGISGLAIRCLTQEGLAETTADPTKRVPMVSYLRHTNHEEVKKGAAPNREAVYFTRPRDEWAQMKAVENATLEIKSQIRSTPNLPDLPVGFEEIITGQKSKTAVVVDFPTSDGELLDRGDSNEIKPISIDFIRDILPASVSSSVASGEFSVTVDDIPVRVVREDVPELQTKYNSKYRPVPGGCAFGDNDSYSTDCTLGTPAHTDDGNHTLVTAGHCTNGSGTEINQPYDLPVNGSIIGDIKESVGENYEAADVTEFDAAYLNFDSDNTLKYRLADSNGSYQDSTVMGTWAYYQIVDWQGTSNQITLQGKESGRESGSVEKVYPETGNYSISASSMVGDSGGPHYRDNDNGEQLIVGIHNGRNKSGAVGTAMEDIESRFNLTV